MANSSPPKVTEPKRHAPWVEFLIRMVKEKPMGTIGAMITLLLLFTGIFANYLAPHGMNELLNVYLSPPSTNFWMGTDNVGRDILSRIIYGARISVIVGLSGALIGTVGSAVIGILCGYIGGTFDLLVQRFVDAVMCLPGLIVLMVIISLVGTGMVQVILVLGIQGGIVGSRMVRSVVISVKEEMYILSAETSGCSIYRIVARHILPNVMAPIIVGFSLAVPGMILAEASLSFLGYGIPPPAPSWGGMLSGSSRTYMFMDPWLAIWPGLALSVVVYGVNMFGDALRDIMDPRLRGSVGHYQRRVIKTAVKSEHSTPDRHTSTRGGE